MEVEKRKNGLQGQASSCQSFSNNYHPSGQLRKISIGITVGASPRERPPAGKENDLVLSPNEKNVCSQGKPTEDRDVALDSSKRKWAYVRPEMHAQEKEAFEGKLEKPANNGREALKMKLWEILGGSPSQDQVSNSQAHKTETNNLKSDKNGDRSAENNKLNLNSDPIETDSDSPDQMVRRPVTRSITRKKGPTKYQPKLQHAKTNDHIFHPVSSFQYKQNQHPKNIFSFDEAEPRAESFSRPFDGNARMSKRKKSDQETSRTKQDGPPKNIRQQEISRVEQDSLPANTQKQEISRTKEDSPPMKNIQQQEDIGSPLSLKTPQVDLRSPTFAMSMPSKNDLPSCPSSERMPGQGEPNIPTPDWRRLNGEGSNNTKQTLELVSDGSEADAESSDDTKDFPTSAKDLSPSMEVKDATNGISPSLVVEQDNENSGTELDAVKKWPSGTCSPEESSFMLCRSRKFCNQESVKLSDLDCPSPSRKGTDNGGDCQGTTEDQENSLTRAISQFAVVLERFKSKMKSQTGRKSSEILASVAERVHVRLQNVESRIQTDVGKFSSLSKAKRKCLESRFQEEQGKLKLIHDKFKNELNHHLEQCRSTVEELEAYQIELKSNAEKQKSLQRKLFLEAEEAIRIQLSDAERSITAIHKASPPLLVIILH
ncbi:hypothetical protein ACLOJK_022149 [Asimina triloba]